MARLARGLTPLPTRKLLHALASKALGPSMLKQTPLVTLLLAIGRKMQIKVATYPWKTFHILGKDPTNGS
jgi:hypothetical protein